MHLWRASFGGLVLIVAAIFWISKPAEPQAEFVAFEPVLEGRCAAPLREAVVEPVPLSAAVHLAGSFVQASPALVVSSEAKHSAAHVVRPATSSASGARRIPSKPRAAAKHLPIVFASTKKAPPTTARQRPRIVSVMEDKSQWLP